MKLNQIMTNAKNKVNPIVSSLFADKRTILQLLKEIGVDLIWIIGYYLTNLSANFNYLREILLSLKEGMEYGMIRDMVVSVK